MTSASLPCRKNCCAPSQFPDLSRKNRCAGVLDWSRKSFKAFPSILNVSSKRNTSGDIFCQSKSKGSRSVACCLRNLSHSDEFILRA